MPDGRPWPKISIVTPLLNQQPFIEETIRSILLQGYPDVEHIVIDGGSTDGSLEVIEQYSSWVKCVVRKGEGQSAAVNRGFKEAAGDLIGWQNSDDFYGPDNFRQAALAAAQYPDCEILNGLVRGFQGHHSQPPWLFENCEEFSRESLLEEMCVMNQSMFFRRTIFDRGIFLKDNLHYSMDWEFFWRLSLEGFRYQVVPSMISYYRQHESAKSNSYNVRSDLEPYAVLRSLCRDKRLDPRLRLRARTQLRKRFLHSFSNARRTVLKKLAIELILPI
ncbi:MAG: glycosyltransferase family 2 protein [Terracidiphilus sp.]|jgi:glycosyltransferase involved in cell wall biosynthesis